MAINTKKKGAVQAGPSGPGRRERRRTETREKLYRAAMKLFAERGFFDTTTEAITEAADVGQGTFFNYFPTKPHILTVLSEKQIEKVTFAIEQVEAGTASIHDVLYQLIQAIAKEPGRSPQLARALLTTFMSSDEVREIVGLTMVRGRQELETILRTGQERGEITADRSTAALAMAFQRSVVGTLLLWSMQPKGKLSSWLDQAFQDFWAGAGVTKGRKG